MKSRKIKMLVWGVVVIALVGITIMFLWNWLMPTLLGLPTISFLQSIGLFALTRILFGGFGRMGHGFGNRGNRFREKWEQMSPEKRQEFLARRARFGFRHHPFNEQHDEESKAD